MTCEQAVQWCRVEFPEYVGFGDFDLLCEVQSRLLGRVGVDDLTLRETQQMQMLPEIEQFLG